MVLSIPDPVQPRSLRSPHVSYSGLSMLTSCERKWCFKYRDGLELVPTAAMSKGRFFHELTAAWWSGEDWRAVAKVRGEEWVAANAEAERLPGWFDDMLWLMERYETHYQDQKGEVGVMATEYPFTVRLPGKYGWLVGVIDGLWWIDDHLWIVERKTMSDWDSLDSYVWDPQTTLYYWVARQLGLDPWGIIIDAARTYRWKQPRPTSDSFRQEFFDRNDTHLEMAIGEAIAGLDRSRALLRGETPLRNVSRDCQWCSFRAPCMQELAFDVPESYEMEA